jgi:predicted nucleic acid-binding protein
MRAIDASSLIYAWDNYPLSHFPKLWTWLADEIEKDDLYVPNAAFIEVGHKLPDCSAWLVECECTVATETHQVLQAALAIKLALGIENDKYHPNGVDENDILIIATAKTKAQALVSNESRQPLLPSNMKRWKIPAVCALKEVGVACNDFVEYFKDSGKVF